MLTTQTQSKCQMLSLSLLPSRLKTQKESLGSIFEAGSQYVILAGNWTQRWKPGGPYDQLFTMSISRLFRRCLKVSSSVCLKSAIPLHSGNSRPLLTQHSRTAAAAANIAWEPDSPSSIKAVLESACRSTSETNQTTLQATLQTSCHLPQFFCLNHEDRLGDGYRPSPLSVDAFI